MDNYCTFIPLANDLLVNHYLYMIDTLQQNKMEIPPELLKVKFRPVCSSMFAYEKNYNCILISFTSKKNKSFLILSTLHDDDATDLSTHQEKETRYFNVLKLHRRWGKRSRLIEI